MGDEAAVEEAAPVAPSGTAPVVADAASERAPVYCGVETRDHQLWVHYGTERDLYTVKAKDGRVLAEEIDDGRLQRDYPSLHELLHGAVDLIGIGADH